jgi:hypothetical protein
MAFSNTGLGVDVDFYTGPISNKVWRQLKGEVVGVAIMAGHEERARVPTRTRDRCRTVKALLSYRLKGQYRQYLPFFAAGKRQDGVARRATVLSGDGASGACRPAVWAA